MAKLTTVKRIFKEQFPPDVQAWIDQLLYPLNNAIAQFTFVLTNNSTFADNSAAITKQFTLLGSSTLTADMTPTVTLTNCKYYSYSPANITTGYGIQVGASVQGIGIPGNTTIQAVSGTNITLSNPCTVTQTGVQLIVGGQFPYSFLHGLAARPTILILDSCLETSASPPPITEGVYIDWYVNGSNIVINNITGLVAGRSYSITVTSLAG